MCQPNKTPPAELFKMVEKLVTDAGYCPDGGAQALLQFAVWRKFNQLRDLSTSGELGAEAREMGLEPAPLRDYLAVETTRMAELTVDHAIDYIQSYAGEKQ